MATHEKGGVAARMRRLLAHHEQAAAALRFSIDLLYGDAAKAKTNGHSAVLANAIALDSARTEKRPKTKTKKRRTRNMHRSAILAKRERTAQVLASFDQTTSRPIAEVAQKLGVDVRNTGVAPLLHHGYLKRKGSGFVRTKKPYVVNPFASAEA